MGQKDGSGEIKDKGEGKMGFECYIYVYIDIGKVISSKRKLWWGFAEVECQRKEEGDL